MVESGFNNKFKIFCKNFTSFFAKKLADFEFREFFSSHNSFNFHKNFHIVFAKKLAKLRIVTPV